MLMFEHGIFGELKKIVGTGCVDCSQLVWQVKQELFQE